MFGRSTRKARHHADAADRAFAEAEAAIVNFGKAVAGRITIEFQAGRIDAPGIDKRINLALEQCAGAPVTGVPKFALKQLLSTLHETIIAELSAAGLQTGPEVTR